MSSTLGDVIGRGATGSKPAAGTAGRLYYDTTLSRLERDNGSSWDVVEGAGAALTVQEIDGTPSDTAVTIIRVTNGKLTDNGAGDVTLDLSGSGSSGAPKLPLDDISNYGSGDSFAGTSLDGGWSSLQSTGLTATDASVEGFLVLKNTGNTSGQDRGLKRTFSPAGDFTVWCKVNFATLIADFQWFGIFVGETDPSDAASADRLELLIVRNGAAPNLKFAKYAAGVETGVFDTDILNTAVGIGFWQFPVWLKISRTSTTLTASWSLDGVQWVDHATTTTIAFTVGTCGVILGESTATNNVRATFDYIATTG